MPMNAGTARALLQRLRRAEAAGLARAGHHDAALDLLAGADAEDPATLDLLARVHAQRGDLAAAEAVWRQVLALDPHHAGALAGSQLAADIREGRRRPRPLPVRTAGTAAALLALAVAAGGAALALDRDSGSKATSPAASHPPTAPTAPPTTTGPGPTVQLQALAAELAGPEVKIQQRDKDLRIVFNAGLFGPDSTDLTPTGRQALTALGHRLRDKPVHVTVLGHGVAIAGGPTSGGSDIALTRATTAAQTLAESSGLPLTTFSATTADQAAPPWPPTSPQPDPRNRTVTLLITPT